MRYFIAYVLDGEARRAHEKLVSEIDSQCGLSCSEGNILPHIPHITFKAPFDADAIQDIEKILAEFSQTHRSEHLQLQGFGYFERSVVFIDVIPSLTAQALIQDLADALQAVPWLVFGEFDGAAKKLHVTLAHKNIEDKFDTIWEFLSGKDFSFSVSLDAISILRKECGRWQIHRRYALQKR